MGPDKKLEDHLASILSSFYNYEHDKSEHLKLEKKSEWPAPSFSLLLHVPGCNWERGRGWENDFPSWNKTRLSFKVSYSTERWHKNDHLSGKFVWYKISFKSNLNTSLCIHVFTCIVLLIGGNNLGLCLFYALSVLTGTLGYPEHLINLKSGQFTDFHSSREAHVLFTQTPVCYM